MKNKELKSEWRSFFKGKKITVMGLGLLGRGVGDIEFLAKYSEEIIVTDIKSKKDLMASISKLKGFKNIKYVLGKHRLKDFENRDFIIKAAGVPFDSSFINHAKAKKVPVYMSTALFALLTPSKVVGITGTRGKTTVTYMIYEIMRAFLKAKKVQVFLGGNIQGVATLPFLEKTKKTDWVVLELDSWQLQGFGDLKISPDIAVFTTFLPDHLNYYQNNLMRYFRDKTNIFAYQKNKGKTIIGEQLCTLPTAFTKLLPKKTKFTSERALPKNLLLKIPGDHNRYNAALAFVVGRSLGIPIGVIGEVLENFKGVDGRLQKVSNYENISVYNDTTSTTPQSLVVAIESIGKDKNISLIMGGSDKNLDLRDLRKMLNRHCVWISLLSGSGTSRLLRERIIPKDIPFKISRNLKEATLDAFTHAPSNGSVLFSPGFASFGMFKNEYDRGEKFMSVLKKYKTNELSLQKE